ncbi:MAG: hypothetical protein KBD06_05520 [Candidatus Pacebacteria bacterium]|nr:hypothetical protein [Candidatus Paceibacterota bacterium]
MSTTQVSRNGSQSFSARGARFHQPQLKEERKSAIPKDRIEMPNGTFITPAAFHNMRSASHQKFDRGVGGMSERVRQRIPRSQWAKLVVWMDTHRGHYGNKTTQNDNFLAVLIDHAATSIRGTAPAVLKRIMDEQSADILLTTRQ